MNPLYRNDAQGTHPPSWYTATADIPELRPALDGSIKVDVAILGGGYCGLWAAKTLAEKGHTVAVMEAHRVGFGASGRNGGQVGSGFNKDQLWLEKHLGRHKARALWDLAEAAKTQVRDFIATEAPEALYKPGVAHGVYSAKEARELQSYSTWLTDTYGYDAQTYFEVDDFRSMVKTPRYCGGIVDWRAGHIHPLRYALALAKSAERAGAKIYEMTEVTEVSPGSKLRFVTPKGVVTAAQGVIAGNGYLPNLHPSLSAKVMPINSFIAATAPLDDQQEVLAHDIAVDDSKFVVNYYRMSEDNRFLFGGRESYTLGFPKDISSALRQRMVGLFPQLEDVEVTHVWGGTLGITMRRLPFVAALDRNLWAAGGFSGHGVALAGFSGSLIGKAIIGETEQFDIISNLPALSFPGGDRLRAPLLTLGMTWYALRDRLGL